MTSLRGRAVWFASLVLAIQVAGCNGSPLAVAQEGAASVAPTTVAPTGPATVPPIAPFPSVVMPDQLRGLWTADVQRRGPTNGAWSLGISEHGMELKNPIAATDDDYFWLSVDRIDDRSFHLAADEDCGPATYAWAIEAGQLAMTTTDDAVTDDGCGDRRVTLTTPFTRQP
jgi:hypothetical protein